MKKTFKGVFLDKNRIDDVLRFALPEIVIDGPEQKQGYIQYTLTPPEGPVGMLQIFHKADGTSTLHYKVGANQDLSYLAAEFIDAECRRTEYQPRPLALDTITEANWDFLLGHLKDDWGFELTEEPLQHGRRFRVKKCAGDEVLLHRYHNGTFLMQGKAREVYSIVANVLCEITPDKKEVVSAQLKSFDVYGLKASEVTEELTQWVPSAVGILGETGVAIMSPSLALVKLEMQLPDYSAFAHPVLRGLEAYMKALMGKHGYVVKNNTGFGDYFNGNVLKISVRDRMNCVHTVAAVEESYAVYNKHRHSLFHVDANIDSSRILEDKEEAVSIIHEVLQSIQRTASAIPSL